jgi:hypothetical protein
MIAINKPFFERRPENAVRELLLKIKIVRRPGFFSIGVRYQCTFQSSWLATIMRTSDKTWLLKKTGSRTDACP